MLAYYPEDDLYIAQVKDKGCKWIDEDSAAFAYCEYLRSNFGATEAKDLDGEYYLVIMVSDYRVEQIHTFVGLEANFKYLMAKGI